VVVRERSEWFGDEKVLLLPKLLKPVSAFDLPEWTVSGLVATVGAVDLLLLVSARFWLASWLCSTDVKLSAERGVAALEKERRLPVGFPLLLTWPDSGYGLFLAAAFFVFDGVLAWFFLLEALGESEEDLRFARRFMKPAKGRLRACRSFGMLVSSMGIQTR
jgi:hypothetical protein